MKALVSLAILTTISVVTCFTGYCLFIGMTHVYAAVFGVGLAFVASLATMVLIIIGLIVLAIFLKPITALLMMTVLYMIQDILGDK